MHLLLLARLNDYLTFSFGGQFIREHCNEIRRRVQLAKKLNIQNLEDMSEKLPLKIDEHEKKESEAFLNANHGKFMSKLYEMKLQNEKWIKCLREHEKITDQFVEEINQWCLSKLSLERKKMNRFLLNEQSLEFKEAKDEFGEIVVVPMESFEEDGVVKFDLETITFITFG